MATMLGYLYRWGRVIQTDGLVTYFALDGEVYREENGDVRKLGPWLRQD